MTLDFVNYTKGYFSDFKDIYTLLCSMSDMGYDAVRRG